MIDRLSEIKARHPELWTEEEAEWLIAEVERLREIQGALETVNDELTTVIAGAMVEIAEHERPKGPPS